MKIPFFMNLGYLNDLNKSVKLPIAEFFHSNFSMKITEITGSVAAIAGAIAVIAAVILKDKLLLIGGLVVLSLGFASWFYVREFRATLEELNDRITVQESAEKMQGQQQEIESTVTGLEKEVFSLRSSKEDLEKKIHSFSKSNEELVKQIEVLQQKNTDFFELEKSTFLTSKN